MYKLFLDDERLPVGRFPVIKSKIAKLLLIIGIKINWPIICRSYREAVNLVYNHGIPNHIDFDHDLGEGENGFDFAKFLINADLDNLVKFPKNFTFYVHSQNPIGKMNIESLLNSYLK